MSFMSATNEHRSLVNSLDSCPWCPDEKPCFEARLTGMRDDPHWVAKLFCRKCGATKEFAPCNADTDAAHQLTNRVSFDRKLFFIMLPKIVKIWNWKEKIKE